MQEARDLRRRLYFEVPLLRQRVDEATGEASGSKRRDKHKGAPGEGLGRRGNSRNKTLGKVVGSEKPLGNDPGRLVIKSSAAAASGATKSTRAHQVRAWREGGTEGGRTRLCVQ